jgi:hypothetical protein
MTAIPLAPTEASMRAYRAYQEQQPEHRLIAAIKNDDTYSIDTILNTYRNIDINGNVGHFIAIALSCASIDTVDFLVGHPTQNVDYQLLEYLETIYSRD